MCSLIAFGVKYVYTENVPSTAITGANIHMEDPKVFFRGQFYDRYLKCQR
jgi:uncharacterized membrane protein